jgi:YVTN family beta-propeller protein
MKHRILLIVMALSVVPVSATAVRAASNCLGPQDVLASPDGASLYVLAKDAGAVLVVDPAQGTVVRKLECAMANAIALSPDGKTLFVAGGGAAGSVRFLDAATGQEAGAVAVGHTPAAVAVTPDGKRLYVCNQFNNDVSVIDVEAKQQTTRLPMVREPISAAVSPDGKLVLVANFLPNDPGDSYDVAAVINVINTADHAVSAIRLLNGSTDLRNVCVSPDGKYGFAVHLLSRYQLPTTQLERGWVNTNALTILDLATGKLLNTVLLDEVDLGAANPWDVACTADGTRICVTHAGTHEVSVINTDALLKKLATFTGDPRAQGDQYSVVAPPNDLAFLVDLRQRIRIQGRGPWGWLDADRTEANGPRGMAIVGTKLYAAAYFSDKLAVVDLQADPRRAVSLIALGPKPEMSPQRYGEMNFHDAWLCFQHWQSCASCHPGDARIDGLNWDLLNDGLGTPKNNKSMLLTHQTPPAMSVGVRETAEEAVRSGFKNILFLLHPETIHASVDDYLKSLTPVPSPHLVNGQLSEAAQRGKELFHREALGCASCHPEPLFTDLKSHNVNSRGQYDRHDTYDTPTLVECWRTAPYMHDGHFVTLQELFRVGKHGRHSADMEALSEQQINDLVEYVLSL